MSQDNQSGGPEPRKINPAAIEIIGTHGERVKEAANREGENQAHPFFGQMKVMKAGPGMILLLPILIPLVLFAFLFIAVLAAIFGRGMFKMVSGPFGRGMMKK